MQARLKVAFIINTDSQLFGRAPGISLKAGEVGIQNQQLWACTTLDLHGDVRYSEDSSGTKPYVGLGEGSGRRAGGGTHAPLCHMSM